MNWLDSYNRFQLDKICTILGSFQLEDGDTNSQLVLLDDALNIWSLPPDAWSEPDVLEWAALFDRYLHKQSFDEHDRAILSNQLVKLRKQIVREVYLQMLSVTNLNPETEIRRRTAVQTLPPMLWRYFYDIEYVLDPDAGGDLRDALYDFEDAVEFAGNYNTQEYTDKDWSMITSALRDIRALLTEHLHSIQTATT